MAVSEGLVAELAGAVLDGTPIDWAAAESSADEADRALLEHLRVMATLADLHRRQPVPRSQTPLAGPRASCRLSKTFSCRGALAMNPNPMQIASPT